MSTLSEYTDAEIASEFSSRNLLGNMNLTRDYEIEEEYLSRFGEPETVLIDDFSDEEIESEHDLRGLGQSEKTTIDALIDKINECKETQKDVWDYLEKLSGRIITRM